jgi:tRNA threonylcarbamoyladenosine biosynthesis protein TsaE
MGPASIITEDAMATQRCGAVLAPLLEPGDVLLLSGDLGAGKTQLTKGLAAGLGVPESVTSPTFNMLLVHEGRITLYHFDLYRLDDAAQLEDLDYFGTLEAGGVSVVEWGDRFAEAAPPDGLSVSLQIEGDERRRIELNALGPRGEALATLWLDACANIEDARVSDGAAT